MTVLFLFSIEFAVAALVKFTVAATVLFEFIFYYFSVAAPVPFTAFVAVSVKFTTSVVFCEVTVSAVHIKFTVFTVVNRVHGFLLLLPYSPRFLLVPPLSLLLFPLNLPFCCYSCFFSTSPIEFTLLFLLLIWSLLFLHYPPLSSPLWCYSC